MLVITPLWSFTVHTVYIILLCALSCIMMTSAVTTDSFIGTFYAILFLYVPKLLTIIIASWDIETIPNQWWIQPDIHGGVQGERIESGWRAGCALREWGARQRADRAAAGVRGRSARKNFKRLYLKESLFTIEFTFLLLFYNIELLWVLSGQNLHPPCTPLALVDPWGGGCAPPLTPPPSGSTTNWLTPNKQPIYRPA